MAQAHEARFDDCRGEHALMRHLRAAPDRTGAHFGREGFRLCNWSTRVEAYQLPAVPEWILALHTAGASVDRTGPLRPARTRSMPGQLTVRPPHVSDAYRPRGPFRCTTLHVSASKVQDIAEQIGQANPARDVPYRFGVDDPLLSSVLTSLSREIESPAECGTLIAERLVDVLIIAMLRTARSGTSASPAGHLSPWVMRRVRERIQASLSLPIAVADLADEAGLSPFHFARAFKLTTGLSPHRFVTERRIELAKSLLTRGDLSIARIAQEAGFTSQQHFTGIFHRLTGAPPGAYRRLCRETRACADRKA